MMFLKDNVFATHQIGKPHLPGLRNALARNAPAAFLQLETLRTPCPEARGFQGSRDGTEGWGGGAVSAGVRAAVARSGFTFPWVKEGLVPSHPDVTCEKDRGPAASTRPRAAAPSSSPHPHKLSLCSHHNVPRCRLHRPAQHWASWPLPTHVGPPSRPPAGAPPAAPPPPTPIIILSCPRG